MSQPVYTLTPCSYCKRGYRGRDMHAVEGKLLCEECYRRKEALDEVRRQSEELGLYEEERA